MDMDRFRMLPNYQYYDDSIKDTNTVTIDSKYTKQLRDYRIYGNSIQDGTPSPDNPIAIESVGDYDEATGKYKIPIEVKGKNLFEGRKPPAQGYKVNASWEPYKNGYKLTAGVNTGGWSVWVRIPMIEFADIKWGQTYTLSCYVKQSDPNMGSCIRPSFVTKDGGTGVLGDKVAENNSINHITFTLPEAQHENFFEARGIVLHISVQPVALDACESICITDIMLVEGEEPVEYTPYFPKQTYDILLDEPLRKCGDYADYIDFKSGKIVRNIKKIVLNGSNYNLSGETMNSYNSDISTNRYMWMSPAIVNSNGTTVTSSVTHLSFCKQSWADKHGVGYCTNSTYQFHMRFSNETLGINTEDDAATRTQKMKDYIINQYTSGNPVVLHYAMANTTETPIELPQPLLHKGMNTITVKTTTQPSQVNWQYYK